MLENTSIRYVDGTLFCDSVSLVDLVEQLETPVYVYSLPRVLENLQRIKTTFADLDAHIHYSAKANANMAILRALIQQGAGIDAVSGGEIHRALKAGAAAEHIVFAGVGKTKAELQYALEQGVGWINAENVDEVALIETLAQQFNRSVRVALRLNPDIPADTHHHIATGHGKAKFGLTAQDVELILKNQAQYPHLRFEGIHVHIGSQLHSTDATTTAIETALEIIKPYSKITSVNIGGGLPVAYQPDQSLPEWTAFAQTAARLLKGYQVILEPGRSIVADAGLLLTRVLYVKRRSAYNFAIVDASMSELIRPALYQAHHEIVPLHADDQDQESYIVVGPVCETTDVLSEDTRLPRLASGDVLAILTAGAYGMVMASNYNQRGRPAEVVVEESGDAWRMVRKRETWDDLLNLEA